MGRLSRDEMTGIKVMCIISTIFQDHNYPDGCYFDTHYFVCAFGAANGTEMLHFTLKVIEV